MEAEKSLIQQLKDYFDNTPRDVIEKEWHEYDKYNDISPKVNEYLEYVNNIRQPKYPKTYEECCKIKQSDPNFYIDTHLYSVQLASLYKLLICRDVYWKLYGEQMGLGKPWEPDWENSEEGRYCIVNIEGDINLPEKMLTKWILKVTNKILVFPTVEMRDAFYENFNELIEKCKKLL